MPRSHLLIVGAGVAGAFAAYAASRRGARVTLLERFTPGHDRGSSHGGSRIFRHAYETSEYVRLAVRADEGWRALEHDTGERLLWRAGGLDLATTPAPSLDRIEQQLIAHGSAVERLDAHEVRRRFPAFVLPSDREALFQPEAGVVAADRALTAALRRAVDRGADLHFGAAVARIGSDSSGVVVHTEDGRSFRADRGVLAAGPWLSEGDLRLDLPLRIEQQQVVYLSAPSGPTFAADELPVFIDRDALFYGMGRLEHPSAIKVAGHAGAPTIRLDQRATSLDEERARATEARVRSLLPSVGRRMTGSLCLYTMSPDEDFVIGPHPAAGSWIVAGGLSGHGFKFAPALGDMLSELALDGSSRWWSPRFAPDRFARTTETPPGRG